MERYDISLGGIFGHDTTEQTTPDDTVEHSNDPSYPIFTPDLEPISDEMIAELKEVWYQKVYAAEYAAYSKLYAAQSDLSDKEKEDRAKQSAEDAANRHSRLLFSPASEDHFYGRYYGTIADCVIFAYNTRLEDEYNVITVGRTSIVNDHSIYIFAYKDGVIKEIEIAYSEGWLNAGDIEKIKERHDKFNAYKYWEVEEAPVYSYARFVSDLEDISDQKIKQINNTLFNDAYDRMLEKIQNDPDLNLMYDTRRIKESAARDAYVAGKSASQAFIVNNRTVEDFEDSFRYYGTFGNCVIWAEVSDAEAETEYDLMGLILRYTRYTQVKVYTDGKIYDLQDAFNNDMIDIDNTWELYQRHIEYDSYLTSRDGGAILSFPDEYDESKIFAQISKGGWVTFFGDEIYSGEELWYEFYESYLKGKPAAVQIAHYYQQYNKIKLTTLVYNGNVIVQTFDNRKNGTIGVKGTGVYKYIINYDGANLDKSDTVYDHEETYILVNDNTLTYPKIKESGTSINHYVAFSPLSRVDDTPVSFNITPEQEAIITEIFGHYYSHNEGHWKYWFDEILTAKEAEIWNREAPSDIISILDFLSSNSRCYRLWRSSGSSSSDSKINHVEITPEQDAIITELVPAEYKCYAGYWDIWFYKMLYSIETKEWNSTQPATSSEIQQLMEKFNIYNRLTTNVPIYP